MSTGGAACAVPTPSVALLMSSIHMREDALGEKVPAWKNRTNTAKAHPRATGVRVQRRRTMDSMTAILPGHECEM